MPLISHVAVFLESLVAGIPVFRLSGLVILGHVRVVLGWYTGPGNGVVF